MGNTWPNGQRRAMYPHEHEAWNESNYPGTRQLCVHCDEPTGRCEEDPIYAEYKGDDQYGPLCEACNECLEP